MMYEISNFFTSKITSLIPTNTPYVQKHITANVAIICNRSRNRSREKILNTPNH